MTVQMIMQNKSTDGLGTGMVNGGSLAIFAVTFKGFLGRAFLDILIDVGGGTDYVVAGQLSQSNPVKLIMLPANAKINAKLSGCDSSTLVTVEVAS